MFAMQATIDQLKTLRSELTNRIKAIDADVHHKNESVEKDFAEQATQRENDEVLNAIDEEAQQSIQLIDAALTRIKEGSYEICASCGIKIPDERVSALSYVTTCVSCTE